MALFCVCDRSQKFILTIIKVFPSQQTAEKTLKGEIREDLEINVPP